MQLTKIEDSDYDLVYTSNGTHSWITDLPGMYRQICRVLKPSGYSVMYDVHPFHRPFTDEVWKEPKIKKSYFDGAAELQAADASFWFKYHELIHQPDGILDRANDWKQNPMAALPAWLTVIARKS